LRDREDVDATRLDEFRYPADALDKGRALMLLDALERTGRRGAREGGMELLAARTVEKHELSICTKPRSKTWATPGGTAANITLPAP
jgi:hypothetical protein